jgi:hypothetical protein
LDPARQAEKKALSLERITTPPLNNTDTMSVNNTKPCI